MTGIDLDLLMRDVDREVELGGKPPAAILALVTRVRELEAQVQAALEGRAREQAANKILRRQVAAVVELLPEDPDATTHATPLCKGDPNCEACWVHDLDRALMGGDEQ